MQLTGLQSPPQGGHRGHSRGQGGGLAPAAAGSQTVPHPRAKQSRLPPPRGSQASEEFNVMLGAREGHVGVFLLPACDL